MWTAGIDAHDRMYVMCVLDQQGKTVREHTVRGGPAEVAAWVGALGGPTRACYEASLGYGLLHDALGAVGVEVQVAHPTQRATPDRWLERSRVLPVGDWPETCSSMATNDPPALRAEIAHGQRIE